MAARSWGGVDGRRWQAGLGVGGGGGGVGWGSLSGK